MLSRLAGRGRNLPAKTNTRPPLSAAMIFICPGCHDPALTTQFLHQTQLQAQIDQGNGLVFPVAQQAPFWGFNVRQFLKEELSPQADSPLTFISFSAGVVGAIAAAHSWQHQGGVVGAFIALDGWGVILTGDFPIYRLSHDEFTHHTSVLLGHSVAQFYADPAVDHLALWQSPQAVMGWTVERQPTGEKRRCDRTTAAEFIHRLLKRHQAISP